MPKLYELSDLILIYFCSIGKSSGLIDTDKSTGLMKARQGSHMLLSDGSMRPVSNDCFIHPQTGHILPIAGNVAFDPITSRLVFVTDSATSKLYFLTFTFIGQDMSCDM